LDVGSAFAKKGERKFPWKSDPRQSGALPRDSYSLPYFEEANMNSTPQRLLVGLWLFSWCGPAFGEEKPTWPRPDPGPGAVATITFEWKDATRDRVVPVRIYYPRDAAQPAPVVVFSHGTGGSRDGYAYLGNFWASHGYVCVHPQHAGSDAKAFIGKVSLLEAMKKAIADPRNAIERPRDISFVLDQMTMLNMDDATFKGKLNLDAVGLAGHSFGAHTTLVTAGQAMARLKLADKRIKAIIPMSASAPMADPARAYAGVKVPMLLMSGTLDDSPLGETRAKDRRIPFDQVSGVDKYFINFEGGDHMIFSGRLKGDRKQDAEFQRAIKQSTLAFWDKYLKSDAKAGEWLDTGLTEYLGKLATLELKSAR
jgi:predicted dienelactone hydrolase